MARRFWKNFRKILRENWQNVILTLTFLAIALSVYESTKSIKQQHDFNIAIIRPCIYVSPSHRTATRITDEETEIHFELGNYGKSPAYNVEHSSIFSFNDNFLPIEIKKDLFSVFPKVIFPDVTNEIILPVKLPKRSELSSKDKIYLHTYLKYYDFSNHKYFFKAIFLTKIRKRKRGRIDFIEFIPIKVSDIHIEN